MFKVFATVVLAMFIIWLLALGIFYSLTPKAEPMEDRTVLMVDLNFVITDAPSVPEISQIVMEAVSGSTPPRRFALRELVDTLEAARDDHRISAIVLRGNLAADGYGSSLAAIGEVRRALESFRTVEKPVIAYIEGDRMRDLYIKSVADTIYMNPVSDQLFNGLGASMLFLGDAFRHLGVEMTVFQGGKYKTAYDFLTRDSMSEADREQMRELIDDLWNSFLGDIADARGLSEVDLADLSKNEPIPRAETMLEAGLVDGLYYWDEVVAELRKHGATAGNADGFRQISLASYLLQQRLPPSVRKLGPSSQVAIIYAEGVLIPGASGEGYADSGRIARLLRDARQDPDVKAVVLRVNSPGGVVQAGEDVLRELKLANERKPVVVSMGGMATSGGYWISCAADRILVEPVSITGSIGVVGMHYNVSELAGKLHLNFETIGVHERSDFLNVTRALTEDEKLWFSHRIDHSYRMFVDRVADGRDMTWNAVHDLAQGRVWTGNQAMENGLADELGGLKDAVRIAADLAGMDPGSYRIKDLPERTEWEQMLEIILESDRVQTFLPRLGRISGSPQARLLRRHWEEWSGWENTLEPRAELPFRFVLE